MCNKDDYSIDSGAIYISKIISLNGNLDQILTD